jgi:CubicO group peptidase (beta-lactamase class C family)
MRIPIRLFLAVLLLHFFSASIHAQDIIGQWEEYLEAQQEVNHFMGSVLIAQKGKILFRKGYDQANVECGVPNTPQTKFRIGSLTKQFTAAAVLLLQERGQLNVQDPIAKYIGNAPEAWKDVTIHHLLKHTSGIPSFTDLPGYVETWMIPSRPDKTMLRFRDIPLEFAPGMKFNYSNSGYILLALIIENASEMPYEDFLRQNVFDPLDMKDSGHDTFTAILKHRASGYIWTDAGLEHAPYCDMELPMGGGDLYSTVDDLFKWHQALYTDRLLSEASRTAMFTPNESGYGYGWGVSRFFKRAIHSHAGGINGFASQIIRFPEQDVFFIILSNQENSPVMQIGRDLMAIFFAEPYELPKI